MSGPRLIAPKVAVTFRLVCQMLSVSSAYVSSYATVMPSSLPQNALHDEVKEVLRQVTELLKVSLDIAGVV